MALIGTRRALLRRKPVIVSGGGGSLFTYNSSVATNLTTSPVSYTSQSWGAGYVIVAVQYYAGGAAGFVTQVDVGGDTAFTLVSSSRAYNAASPDHIVELWQSNSTKTSGSGTVTVTYTNNPSFVSAVGVYTLVTSTPAAGTPATAAPSTGSTSYSIGPVTVPASGSALIAAFGYVGSTQSITSGNATFDAPPVTSGGTSFYFGHTTATGSVTVTVDNSVSDATTVSLVPWGP